METDTGVFQLVLYNVGTLEDTNQAASPVMAAYYGYPKGASEQDPVAGVIHIHGGGQRAEINRVESWVELGFAAMSINWGGRVLEEEDTPNTDWDGLAAGFVRPGIEDGSGLTHHNSVAPSEHTLYSEMHPMNSSWILVSYAARRALTFLEQRPEVDGERLGVEAIRWAGA